VRPALSLLPAGYRSAVARPTLTRGSAERAVSDCVPCQRRSVRSSSPAQLGGGSRRLKPRKFGHAHQASLRSSDGRGRKPRRMRHAPGYARRAEHSRCTPAKRCPPENRRPKKRRALPLIRYRIAVLEEIGDSTCAPSSSRSMASAVRRRAEGRSGRARGGLAGRVFGDSISAGTRRCPRRCKPTPGGAVGRKELGRRFSRASEPVSSSTTDRAGRAGRRLALSATRPRRPRSASTGERAAWYAGGEAEPRCGGSQRPGPDTATRRAARPCSRSNCGRCHRLFGEAATSAPTSRTPAGPTAAWLLTSVVDPSAGAGRTSSTRYGPPREWSAPGSSPPQAGRGLTLVDGKGREPALSGTGSSDPRTADLDLSRKVARPTEPQGRRDCSSSPEPPRGGDTCRHRSPGRGP